MKSFLGEGDHPLEVRQNKQNMFKFGIRRNQRPNIVRVRNLKFATYLKFYICGYTMKINELSYDYLNVE